MPSKIPVYMHGVAVDPASRGLDPKKYRLTLSVDRIDEKAMSESELERIDEALAADRMPEASTAKKKPATKGKAAKGKAAKKVSPRAAE